MTSVIDTSRLGKELLDLSPGGADEDKSRYFAAVEGLLENLTEDQRRVVVRYDKHWVI